MNLFSLSLLFMKFGILCVGGGFMLVPFLSAELVDTCKIITGNEFLSLLSLAQVTPGPIGINAATWIGFIKYGIPGGIIVSTALILPGSILAYIAAKLIDRWRDNLFIKGFFAGAKPASLALMIQAVFVFAALSVFTGAIPFDLQGVFPSVNWGAAVIFVLAFASGYLPKYKPGLLLIFILSGIAGAFFC